MTPKTINLNINKVDSCFVDYLNLYSEEIEKTLFAVVTKEIKDQSLKTLTSQIVEELITSQELFRSIQSKLTNSQDKSNLIIQLTGFGLART